MIQHKTKSAAIGPLKTVGNVQKLCRVAKAYLPNGILSFPAALSPPGLVPPLLRGTIMFCSPLFLKYPCHQLTTHLYYSTRFPPVCQEKTSPRDVKSPWAFQKLFGWFYRSFPRKNRATVPGPEWAPITGPIKPSFTCWTPNFSWICRSTYWASSRQSPWLMNTI